MSYVGHVENKISTTSFNSRAAATLAASAVFQGVGEEVTKYGRAAVSIISDNATDGVLTMETSQDNVTWSGPTRTWANTTISAPHTWNITKKYFRIKYTNGTTAATNLAIQVQYSVNSDVVLGHQLNQTLLDETEAAITRSVLVGKNSDGDYVNVGVNTVGALETSDFMLDVTRGKYPTYSNETKFGYNSDIDTGPEDVWGAGGNYTGQPAHAAGAETVGVFSSNANDTSAGTGARTVSITGLDASFNEQTETITMNGTTSVTSANTYKRVFSAKVLTAGTGGSNAGTITARHTTTTANVFITVPIGTNSSLVACVTIPASKTAFLRRLRISAVRASGSAGSAIVQLLVRNEGGVYQALRHEGVSTNFPLDFTLEGGIEIEEKSDIKVRVVSVSDINTQVSAAFEYLLIDN